MAPTVFMVSFTPTSVSLKLQAEYGRLTEYGRNHATPSRPSVAAGRASGTSGSGWRFFQGDDVDSTKFQHKGKFMTTERTGGSGGAYM